MQRSLEPEIMDAPDAPPATERAFHRDLRRIHTTLGNWSAMLERISRANPKRVIDIGCGDGAFLAEVRNRLNISDVLGVDLKPPDCVVPGIQIVPADAIRDPLPGADVAVSIVTLHHFSPSEIEALIRNVGRSARRFICLDLIRHPLPLALYAVLMTPVLSRTGARDGMQSIRRAYTPQEMRTLIDRAIAGTSARVEHTWKWPYAKQIFEIVWS